MSLGTIWRTAQRFYCSGQRWTLWFLFLSWCVFRVFLLLLFSFPFYAFGGSPLVGRGLCPCMSLYIVYDVDRGYLDPVNTFRDGAVPSLHNTQLLGIECSQRIAASTPDRTLYIHPYRTNTLARQILRLRLILPKRGDDVRLLRYEIDRWKTRIIVDESDPICTGGHDGYARAVAHTHPLTQSSQKSPK